MYAGPDDIKAVNKSNELSSNQQVTPTESNIELATCLSSYFI